MPTKYDIAPFVQLGRLIEDGLRDGSLDGVIARAVEANPWFTADSVRMALDAIRTDMLAPERLEEWLAAYKRDRLPAARSVGIVMAGNIPLVGFFDLLCVLLCGHRALVKPSSKDTVLVDWVCETLRSIDPRLRIALLEEQTPDALIATGSDTTRRHFESRYAGIPALLRGSRHSVALLDGSESPAELDALGEDIFSYFGLGCRNVSRLFIPRDYPLDRLLAALEGRRTDHPGYLGAYRRARALYTMTGVPFTDGGFYLLREGEFSGEPLPVIGYTRYDDPQEALAWIAAHDHELQCVVGRGIDHPRSVAFGEAQHPRLQDYPDGVDVMKFLVKL